MATINRESRDLKCHVVVTQTRGGLSLYHTVELARLKKKN